MKRLFVTVIGIVCLGLFSGFAADDVVSGDVTVITSDKLTFDYSEQYALFEQNVIVTDPDMTLKSDNLRVIFSEAGSVTRIVATDNVVIEQADKIAYAGRAEYTVSDGAIKLTEQPRVRRGKDLLKGETITFWRNQNKMVCEPQARLIIFPEKGGTRDKLFGE